MPNSRVESTAALQDDFYANSSKPSQQSLFDTWSKLAAAWGLQLIPITRELLLSIGASMKHAGYRSPKNYFYKAAQVHREALEQDLPPHLHSLMQKILRSIKRGQGPTPFKDSFELELFHIPLSRQPGVIRQGHWFTDTFAARDITIILLAGGCSEVSRPLQPNSNTFGSTNPTSPNSPTSHYQSRRTTPQANVSAEDIHAYAVPVIPMHCAHIMLYNDIPNDFTMFFNTAQQINYHSSRQMKANSPPRTTSRRSSPPLLH